MRVRESVCDLERESVDAAGASRGVAEGSAVAVTHSHTDTLTH